MGRDWHHRECAWPDRLPLAADAVDVQGHRARQYGAQGPSHARAEGPPRRAIRSRWPAPVPRFQGFRLLHRPHPLCRRRLHGRLTMAAGSAKEAARARIAVVGAGLMGHGIAQVFALARHDVTITDSFAQTLDTAKSRIAANLRDLGEDESAVENVRTCADFAEAVRDADYVVEAVLEDLPLKQKLFAEIERHVRPDTILASNTSVIPITAIMQ